jgi:hypothetical protein
VPKEHGAKGKSKDEKSFSSHDAQQVFFLEHGGERVKIQYFKYPFPP